MKIGESRRMLVCGGAGFIGTHLCQRLLDVGHEVLCVDSFRTGSRHRIAHLLSHPRFEVQRHDVTVPLQVECDAIFNLACPGSPIHYQFDRIHTLKTNVLGALNLLELARRLKVPILQASTSEVYGDPAVHPQREDYWGHVNPIGTRACYDEGKRCAETLFMDYQRQHRLSVKVVRIFNTYGPGMHPADGRVVSNFIVQALLGQPLTIYGDGQQTRSLCFVSDTVEALVRMIDAPANCAGPLNIGNPEEISVREIAELVLALTGSRSALSHLPLPADDPRQRCPDITLARQWLAWAPEVSLREGLGRTIDDFAAMLSERPVTETRP